MNEIKRSRYRGCLLGGAIGDALGASVEFMALSTIHQHFGPAGLTTLAPAYGKLGAITDDTQMTLFTGAGLLRASILHAGRPTLQQATDEVARAYQQWLITQGQSSPWTQAQPQELRSGWLMQQEALFAQRAPGMTCLAALRAHTSAASLARNDSKGCGTVMKVAPIALWCDALWGHTQTALQNAFELASDISAITHGHITGQLSASALTVMLLALLQGQHLDDAIDMVCKLLQEQQWHEETTQALRAARRLATQDIAPEQAIAQLGEGWIAEEALAIALYCCLKTDNIREALLLSANHDGDSDSTGAIVGNLLGAMHGLEALPLDWLELLELREVIDQVARDLFDLNHKQAPLSGGLWGAL